MAIVNRADDASVMTSMSSFPTPQSEKERETLRKRFDDDRGGPNFLKPSRGTLHLRLDIDTPSMTRWSTGLDPFREGLVVLRKRHGKRYHHHHHRRITTAKKRLWHAVTPTAKIDDVNDAVVDKGISVRVVIVFLICIRTSRVSGVHQRCKPGCGSGEATRRRETVRRELAIRE